MISIITPCRNSEKTIRRTIESVISQGLVDYEYILVDGLSDDQTLSIIKEYAEANKQIKYITEQDHSMTEALNKGFRMAIGDIVCSINADDEYMPGALKMVEKKFMENDIDILIGATNFIENDSLFFSTYPKYMTNRFLLNILDCSAPECSVFFKKTTLEKIDYFNEDYKYTQDYELYLRLAKNGYKFEYVNETVSNFYLSDTQYSTKAYEEMLNEACRYNEHPALFRMLKKSHLNNAIKRVLGWTRMA